MADQNFRRKQIICDELSTRGEPDLHASEGCVDNP